MLTSRPSYPLSQKEFRRAVAAGLGRAWIQAVQHGAAPYRAAILDAATHCRIYDAQCEGLRGAWLADLCQSAGVVDKVLAARVPTESWDRDQRCDLLKELHRRGFVEARSLLYESFGKNADTADVYAWQELLEVDGEKGFRFLVRKLGEWLESGDLAWLDPSVVLAAEELLGQARTRELLAAWATEGAPYRSFLGAVDDPELTGAEAPQARPPREEVELVLQKVRSSAVSHHGLGYWGRKASSEELAAVLGVLLAETRPRALENALRCLAGSESPPLDARVFELTAHPDESVRRFAALTLGRHASVAVATFGRSTIEQGDLPLGVQILRRSATPADSMLLIEQLSLVADREEQHDLVYCLTQLLESSPSLRSAELALYCYDRSPCSICRGSAVQLLDRWGERPTWVTEELAHDADVERFGAGDRPVAPTVP